MEVSPRQISSMARHPRSMARSMRMSPYNLVIACNSALSAMDKWHGTATTEMGVKHSNYAIGLDMEC